MDEINGFKPIELQTVDGGSIVISSARRVHTKTLSGTHGHWDDVSYCFKTSGGVELELDTYDLLNFDSFRSEVASKTFRVIDEPTVGMWPVTAAKLLLLVGAAPLEEVVKDEREETAEVKKAA